MPSGKQSLGEFVAANPARGGSKSWWETLPPELIEEIKQAGKTGLKLPDGRTIPLAKRTVVRWLKALGYKATDSCVDTMFKALEL